MSEKYVVTWDMLQIHARKLASRLMPSEQWKGIIAVSRGGLVPGALLARELGIRHVDTVCISSYDHDNQRELKVLKRAEGDGEGFIVIDDLVDTGGTTLKRISSRFSLNRRAVRWLMIMLLIFLRTPGLSSPGIWVWYLYRRFQVVNQQLFRAPGNAGRCFIGYNKPL